MSGITACRGPPHLRQWSRPSAGSRYSSSRISVIRCHPPSRCNRGHGQRERPCAYHRLSSGEWWRHGSCTSCQWRPCTRIAARCTLARRRGIIIKVAFFQLEVIVFSIVSHRQRSPLHWNGLYGPFEGLPGCWIGKVSAPLLTTAGKPLNCKAFKILIVHA